MDKDLISAILKQKKMVKKKFDVMWASMQSWYMYVLVAVPSEPRNLSDVPRPPSSVDLEWIKPETPNGIIRHYIVRYWRQDGTGNVTELDPVNGLHVSIDNLAHSKSYVVTVQAFTVGLGPSARRVVQPVVISKFWCSCKWTITGSV